jgi:hypothetical protein
MLRFVCRHSSKPLLAAVIHQAAVLYCFRSFAPKNAQLSFSFFLQIWLSKD